MTSMQPAPQADTSTLVGWFADVPSAWRRKSWPRGLALAGLGGVIGDAATTSMLEVFSGIEEANPLMASGQAWLGSVPLFMALVSLPLLLSMPLLASFPAGITPRAFWSALLFIAAAKVFVTIWNLTVFGWVHFNLGGLL